MPIIAPPRRASRGNPGPAHVALIALALLAIACAPAGQHVFIAPGPQTILSTTEERSGPTPEHLIFVQNNSSVPITIFSVTLRDCENIKPRCDVMPVNLKVSPSQRVLALRVSPANLQQGFHYQFNFSWHADSSSQAALSALAQSGDRAAQERITARQHADSLRQHERGAVYNDLSRDDFRVLGARIASARAEPESLDVEPGTPASIETIRVLLLDAGGQVLGQTRWLRWRVAGARNFQFTPPARLLARAPGRTSVELELADEAQTMIGHALPPITVPVIAAYRIDPHAPVFTGRALDADARTPLVCARVALEDSAANVVHRDRTGTTGMFFLQAPRPGSYRVRVETYGWSPVYGPLVAAAADEEKQNEYFVRFSEQLLVTREDYDPDFEHARPTAVAVVPDASTRAAGRASRRTAPAAPVVQSVTFGGSEAHPVLGILGRVPQGRTWMQFVVDSAGRVDTASVLLPAGTLDVVRASIMRVLPGIRFAPARQAGMPTCEMMRMEVALTPREP